MDLFDDDLYSVSLTAVPNVLKLYDQLDVKREETLSLIAPKFETPLPSFEPAVSGFLTLQFSKIEKLFYYTLKVTDKTKKHYFKNKLYY